ncbi:MAG: hypothetical protein HRU29_16430 [Rhizobiales bacterium]|nr:hypothetical protein [Hyphomicrobiales bacterium]
MGPYKRYLINQLAWFNGTTPRYHLVSQSGTAREKIFTVLLQLGADNHLEVYQSAGTSIKKAQHAAAGLALERTNLKRPPPKVRGTSVESITLAESPRLLSYAKLGFDHKGACGQHVDCGMHPPCPPPSDVWLKVESAAEPKPGQVVDKPLVGVQTTATIAKAVLQSSASPMAKDVSAGLATDKLPVVGSIPGANNHIELPVIHQAGPVDQGFDPVRSTCQLL